MKTKLIPFSVEKAKAGAKVVTRCGYPVRIALFDVKNEDYPVAAAVRIDEGEIICSYTLDGKHGVNEEDNVEDEDIFDLFIEEEEIKPRRMTYREVSQWLRECPDEFRERKNTYNNVISSTISYREIEVDEPVSKDIVIRRNYGKWEEPIVDELLIKK